MHYEKSSNLITDHFTIGEVFKTQKENVANDIIFNASMLAENVLEPIRSLLGGHALIITSWFRSPALNKLVGSTEVSQHLLGMAVDFKPSRSSIDEAFKIIKSSAVPFDQLIHEGTWIHVSYDWRKGKSGQRNQIAYL